MAIRQLEEIRIPSRNLEETKSWYEDHLQISANQHETDEVKFSFSKGAKLVFYKSEEEHTYPFSPINLNVYDPQNLHRDLFLKGCKLTDINDFYDMLSYEVTDPNELQIGIVGWEDGLQSASFMHLGGYFLPVQNLERAYQWYKDHLGAIELNSFTFPTPMYGELRAITLDHLQITLVEIPTDLFTQMNHPFTLGSNNIQEDYQTLKNAGIAVEECEDGESFHFTDGEGHKIRVQFV
ncbi:VOC family protein [Pontibacillus sp. HMF3514]|uniref:VOC family protein n=1 Tax=Pontibacillus sp. HMF3514 TaxID=2692425 RepID=UPI00132002AB|nr:VOC family protein [Pontibacillus sp. HMF3514]QHE51948.1 hypothetical protein GS400_07860 [Pontibacillus sp. HMF3514]